MLRKKVKSNEGWDNQLSAQENLNGCAHNLNEALSSLKSTVQLLKSVNKESLRQAKVTTFNTPYELVTERDITKAKQDLSKELLPPCYNLLSTAQERLRGLKQDETELYKTLEAQAIHVDRLKRNPQTQTSFQSERINMQRKEELKKKKQQLEQLIQTEQEKINKETNELLRIKANNEELNKRKVLAQSNEGWEQRRIELIKELSELKEEANIKEKQVEEIANSNDKKVESNDIDLNKSGMLFKSDLDKVKKLLNELKQMRINGGNTILHGIIESDTYIQALDKENEINKSNEEIMIEQIKNLCHLIYENQSSGKTAGKIFEMILRHDKATIEELTQTFPWTEDERHHLTSILLELLQAKIINQDGNNTSFY